MEAETSVISRTTRTTASPREPPWVRWCPNTGHAFNDIKLTAAFELRDSEKSTQRSIAFMNTIVWPETARNSKRGVLWTCFDFAAEIVSRKQQAIAGAEIFDGVNPHHDDICSCRRPVPQTTSTVDWIYSFYRRQSINCLWPSVATVWYGIAFSSTLTLILM